MLPVPLLASFIQNPSVSEGGFARLLGLLLVLVHGPLVDVAQQVKQVSHQRAFTCIYMTCRGGEDNVNNTEGWVLSKDRK